MEKFETDSLEFAELLAAHYKKGGKLNRRRLNEEAEVTVLCDRGCVLAALTLTDLRVSIEGERGNWTQHEDVYAWVTVTRTVPTSPDFAEFLLARFPPEDERNEKQQELWETINQQRENGRELLSGTDADFHELPMAQRRSHSVFMTGSKVGHVEVLPVFDLREFANLELIDGGDCKHTTFEPSGAGVLKAMRHVQRSKKRTIRASQLRGL